MKKFHTLLLAVLTLLLSVSCQAKDKNNLFPPKENFTQASHTSQSSIPEPIGYLNDFENLFSPAEALYIDSILAAFDRKTTIQIAVVTIDTTMTTSDSLDTYTFQVGNTWGVGQKSENNGIVIGISKGYRKMRIQNGNGISRVLSDEETKYIIDTVFIPHFREGNYYKGTLSGLTVLMDALEKKYK